MNNLYSFHKIALALASVLLILSSCHSSKSIVADPSDGISGNNPNSAHISAISYESVDESRLAPEVKRLLEEAVSWKGVKYQWGGNDRESGVDCSGYVCQVYKQALSINLPRVSRQQAEWCQPVERENMQPGDLMFFATGKEAGRVSHVGLYIGGGKMLHASSSRQEVMEADITNGYFDRTFVTAGRVEQLYSLIGKNSSNETNEVLVSVKDNTKKDKKEKKEKKEKKDKKGKDKTDKSVKENQGVDSPVVTNQRPETVVASVTTVASEPSFPSETNASVPQHRAAHQRHNSDAKATVSTSSVRADVLSGLKDLPLESIK